MKIKNIYVGEKLITSDTKYKIVKYSSELAFNDFKFSFASLYATPKICSNSRIKNFNRKKTSIIICIKRMIVVRV